MLDNNIILSDTHAHLESYAPEELAKLLERATGEGIRTIIATGITLRSSAKSLEIAERYPDICWVAVGLHPFYATRLVDAVGSLQKLTQAERVVGIGEIGLDFLRGENREAQLTLFHEQLRLARELDLPVIIHTNGALQETMEALANYGIPEKHAVIQGFRGDLTTMEGWLSRGYYLSIGPTILWEPRKSLAEMIRQIPQERLLLETDARAGRTASQGLELATLKVIAETVAGLRGVSVPELARITTDNLREVFRIPDNGKDNITVNAEQHTL